MWTRPSIRDLLDTMTTAAPEAGEARTRSETLALLIALFGPAEGEPDAALRERIHRALDAILAERAARSTAGPVLQVV